MKRVFRAFLLSVFLMAGLMSCTNQEDIIGTSENIHYVNSWIYTTLKDYYYWTDRLPVNTDKTLSPDNYFNSLIYWYDPVTAPDGDRFSWIQENYTELLQYLSGVASNEIGFDYNLYYKDAVSKEVVGVVNYVKKGTPAEAAGIGRGMCFDKVNGQVMTASNYADLLSFTDAQYTLGFTIPAYASDSSSVLWSAGTSKVVETVALYSENPVYLDTVYSQFPGHRIGYFVYNFFAPDAGADQDQSEYDLAMNQVFARFKSAGITDLVLDLRYNSGGYSTSSTLLASEIVPSLSDSNLFVYYEYNDFLTALQGDASGRREYLTTYVKNGSSKLAPVNNVGDRLNKLYVLTGSHTASASELLINSLKPYMEVVLIGDTTYGKNVASTPLYDKGNTDKNHWGMEPIIAKFFNKDGESDFTAGFVPDHLLLDATIGQLQLGDSNERLLRMAMDDILGLINTPAAVQKRSTTLQSNRPLSVCMRRPRGLQIKNLLQ
jgi:carboxyl-terminal processing protease